jgi:hypothetical protein
MPKPRKRACLDTGVCLDINQIFRALSGTYRLPLDECSEHLPPLEVVITVHMDVGPLRWIRMQYPGFDQTIGLTTAPRHFGGHQWYWLCPMTGDRASVLWMPRGQNVFASQRYWKGRGMAYSSQFLSPVDRADYGTDRIKQRLVSSEDDTMWYKPKWMRWRTFHQLCRRWDAYQDVVNDHVIRVVARLMAMTRR